MRTGTELMDSDFVSFELVDENNMLTNAGVLLADESPMRHSRLFCTRWCGLDKASGVMEALDDKEYSGSLVSLLQNGMEFVKNNTKNIFAAVTAITHTKIAIHRDTFPIPQKPFPIVSSTDFI